MPISGAAQANYSGMMANSAGMMNGSSMMGNSSKMMNSSMMKNIPGANGVTPAGKTKSTFNSEDSIVKQGETDKTNPNALSENFATYNSSGNTKQFNTQGQNLLNQLL